MAVFVIGGDELTCSIARVVSCSPEYGSNEFVFITPALFWGTVFLLQQYYEATDTLCVREASCYARFYRRLESSWHK
jgi:hypothetical protein